MNPAAGFPSSGLLTEIIETEGSIASPQFAQELLSFRLKQDAKTRIRELLQKKNAGTISFSEQSTLQE